jgi:hypothetical protein
MTLVTLTLFYTFFLTATYAEFLHNLSCVSCDSGSFIINSLDKYCLRQMAVKAVTLVEVTLGLYAGNCV